VTPASTAAHSSRPQALPSSPPNDTPSKARPPARRVASRADRAVDRSERAPRASVVANPIGTIDFPEELPVSARRGEIAEAIRDHQVVIVSGETGSGKTTQLPKICLSIGRGLGAGGRGLIGHTQPRRLAATATARRIADELKSPLGEHVGFKIRFHDRLSAGASIKLMTDGILLAETQGDPLLSAYDTIIIDEAHERSLNIDFLLGYLKRLLPRRPDLKIIVTSATIDAERFARHFGSDARPAPVIEVSGRLYPVEVRYRPVLDGEPSATRPSSAPSSRDASKRNDPPTIDERGVIDAVVDAVDELARIGTGDVLVFFPGEREIREAAAVLRGHHPPHTEILPLFARLSSEEQERVFKPSNARRIVLATNVAETSLTVPGIRYVVDTGYARVKRYSYRNKVEQLRTESISRAAANQRAGRCGRVAAGVCIRLYEEVDFETRPAFTEPEILRSSLAAVILRMKTLALGDVEAFPFLEPPLPRAITDGYQLLTELGALDEGLALTVVGRELGKLPLDPRIARMIVAARDHDCMTEMLILASALSIQDPRDRPVDQRDAADEAHRQFIDERSDFLSDLKLWTWYAAAADGEGPAEHKLSQRQLRDLCRSRFISPLRMREWRDVHHQLATTTAEHHWRLNAKPATYEQIHKALLAGLLGNVGMKTDEDVQYLGARGIRFTIWPGSALAKKSQSPSGKARWVMAAELVETQRLYARKVARIEPEWIEAVGSHLLKTSHGDPHWEKKPATVVVLERGTVYGLPIYGQRRIDYAPLNPTHAREILLREGLVETMLHRESNQSPPFEARDAATVRMLTHNRKQIASVEELEHKTRRPDVLVDVELLVAFCDERVPAEVASGKAFEVWYREASRQDTRLMYLDRDELMRHEAAGASSDAFPKTIAMSGLVFALDYRFEPGTPRDGVTMTMPLYALNVVDAARCEWLVPGMLKDKVHALIKSLPQKLRRHCVPLPEYAQALVERTDPQGPLIDALIADLREQRNLVAVASDFKAEAIPTHLLMNFRVVDEHGRQLAIGRNLATLRAELGQQARDQFKEAFARVGGVVVARDDVEQSVTPSTTRPVAERAATSPQSSATSLSSDESLSDWTFGTLPELLEVRRGGQVLIGYPALVDRQSHVTLDVFDDPEEAARVHRFGLARLFRLQLSEQLRYLEKNLPDMTRMAMQFMPLGTTEELRDQIVATAIERACLIDPLPTDAAAFAARKDDARSRIVLLANETARTVGTILDQFQAVLKKMPALKPHPAALADIEAQLAALVHKRFVAVTPVEQLAHLPRYLKAIGLRIDKLVAEPARDALRQAEFAPLQKQWQRAEAARKGAVNPGLDRFRWLLEELRVALFAQELRTPMPVSVKRLQKVWESLQR
jgi:ATP-dependent helicase HrpA